MPYMPRHDVRQDDHHGALLRLVITLLIIALIAGVLGFGGIAGAAVGIAKIVFFVALVLNRCLGPMSRRESRLPLSHDLV